MFAEIYWGWGLVVPIVLSVLWGSVAFFASAALEYPLQKRLWSSLLTVLLPIIWCMISIPLPLYFLIFACSLFPYLKHTGGSATEGFVIRLLHLYFMVMQLSVIGVTAIIVKLPMAILLQEALYRIVSISATLTLSSILVLLIPRFRLPLAVLRSQAASKEVKPFSFFVWLCSIFLLLDSILCLSPLEWQLLPVLLLGSTVLIGYLVIRILFHIYHILKIRYLEEDHHRLRAELGIKEQTARELEKQSNTDPLTHTYSRRYLLHEITRYLEQRQPFSLAYLDLDRLKTVNDQYGHSAGDMYLVQFSEQLRKNLRSTDILARIGGDEFAILIPGLSQLDAQARLLQLRTALENTPDSPFPISFSYGLAWPTGDTQETAAQLMRRADQAMYQDKGRTRS